MLLLGGSWGHVGSFFAFFRIFSHFFRIFFAFFGPLTSSWLFLSLFFIFHGFSMDFGRILGGFWNDFSKISWIYFENADFVKSVVFLWENHDF